MTILSFQPQRFPPTHTNLEIFIAIPCKNPYPTAQGPIHDCHFLYGQGTTQESSAGVRTPGAQAPVKLQLVSDMQTEEESTVISSL